MSGECVEATDVPVSRPPAGPRGLGARAVLLVGGCLILGFGIALLLTASLGSDGFSTLVNGLALSTGMPFAFANAIVSVAFISLAWLRGVRPGIGTVVQIVVVGVSVSLLLAVLPTPEPWWGRASMLVVALPVIALGIVAYLGSHTGAGPVEAAALAWDPPVPFRWTYSLVQGGGAVVGWLLGAAAGVGTLAVIVLLGPMVSALARALRIDVHQGPQPARQRVTRVHS